MVSNYVEKEKGAATDPKQQSKKHKTRSEKYMVLQMGQKEDETQDRMLIEYLSKNALAI